MYKKSGFGLISAASLLLAACGGGSESSPPVGSDEWQTLFDGSSLAYLSVVGDANWRIEEDAAVADESSGPSYLVTNDDYADFELDLEFWVTTDANSGIFLRCQDREAIADTTCYEANIYDTRADQTYRTGGIVNVVSPSEFIYTGGQWNRYQITANGSRLQITLNGRNVVDVEDSQFATGPIALQYGAGVVKFRNVRVRPL